MGEKNMHVFFGSHCKINEIWTLMKNSCTEMQIGFIKTREEECKQIIIRGWKETKTEKKEREKIDREKRDRSNGLHYTKITSKMKRMNKNCTMNEKLLIKR